MKVLILLSSLIALSCSQYSIPVNPPLVQIASPSYSQSQLPAGSQAGGIRPVIFNYKATKSNSKSNTYYKPSPIPNAAKAPFPQQPLPNFPGKAQQELPKAPTSFFQQTSYQSKIVKQQNINPRPNSIIPVANLPVQNSPPVAKPYSSVKGNGGTAQYVSNSIQGSQGGQKTSYNTMKTVSQISQPSFSPLKPVSQNFQTSIVPQQATRAKGIKVQYNGLSPVQGQIPAPVDQSLKFDKSSYSGTQSGVTKGAFKSQNVQAFSSGQNIKQGYPKEIPSNPQALIPPPTAGQIIYARPTPAPVKISYETPSSKVSINGVTSPFQYSTTASLIEVTTPVPFTSNGFDQSNEYKGSAGGAIRNGGGFQNNAVQQNYRQKLISGSGTEANFQQPIPSPLEQPPQSFGPTEPGYKGNQASIVGGSQFSPQSASYNNGVPAKSLNTKVISAPENAYGNVNTAAITSAINQVNSQSSFQNNKEFNSQVNQFGSQSDYQSKITENFGFKSGNQQDFVKQTQFEQKENSNAGYKKQVESAQGSEGQEQFFEEVQENTQVNNGGSGFSSLSDQTFSNGQSENAGKYGDQGSTVGSGFELEDVRQYEKDEGFTSGFQSPQQVLPSQNQLPSFPAKEQPLQPIRPNLSYQNQQSGFSAQDQRQYQNTNSASSGAQFSQQSFQSEFQQSSLPEIEQPLPPIQPNFADQNQQAGLFIQNQGQYENNKGISSGTQFSENFAQSQQSSQPVVEQPLPPIQSNPSYENNQLQKQKLGSFQSQSNIVSPPNGFPRPIQPTQSVPASLPAGSQNIYSGTTGSIQTGFMPYRFAWTVKDDYGNDYGHAQNSDEYGITNGEYRVLLPDGRLQTVIYKVTPSEGYTANVGYKPVGGNYVSPARYK